ncbi:MAG: hypothetical protein LC791_06995 [Acidobacteria bacterium]|nr:hypothetical protein [Acidobacteriota bacterium]
MSNRTLIRECVIFGASGDLASRYLFPALAELWEAGQVPADLRILGVTPEEWDDSTFRRHVAGRTAASRNGREALPDDFLQMLRYEPANITNLLAASEVDAAGPAGAAHHRVDRVRAHRPDGAGAGLKVSVPSGLATCVR